MPKGSPRSARWVALEQAEAHLLRETLEEVAAGRTTPGTALALLAVYGESCAQRASELSRHAAEQRARRRIKAEGAA